MALGFFRRLVDRRNGDNLAPPPATPVAVVPQPEPQLTRANPSPELRALPGVGPTLAQRLADAGYSSTDDLRRATDDELRAVPGIGPGTLERIREQIRPGAAPLVAPKELLIDRDGQPPRAVHSQLRSERSASELIGLVKGIMADDDLSEEEFRLLVNWFNANPDASESWPGNTILAMLEDIVADGVVDPEEVLDLENLLRKVIGGGGGVLAAQNAPTMLPLSDPPPALTFTGQVYVFTGLFAFGPRKACEEAVMEAGGRPERDVTMRTNVVVIGTLASRDWYHTSYGRKIEKAVEYRDRGLPIVIVSEDHWAEALA